MPERLNTLAELLDTDHILLDAEVRTKQEVFALAEQLFDREPGMSQLQVADNLHAREQLGSTALGFGVAVPHARIAGLNNAYAAYIRPRMSISFDAPDGKPVSDIVVILVPQQATSQHLRLLAGIADLFQDDEFRRRLAQCADGLAVSQLFAAFAQQHGA